MRATFVYVRGLAFLWVVGLVAVSGLAAVLDVLFGLTFGSRPVATASGMVLGRVILDAIAHCLRRRAAGPPDGDRRAMPRL